MSRRLLLNSVSGTTLFATRVVVTFIMAPVYISVLGNRDYGLWELVMSVMGYMGLLDLGIGGALVRFVSIADGSQDWDDLQQTISTAFLFFLIVGFVAVLIFIMISSRPGLIGGEEIRDIANLRTVFLLLGVNAGILFPLHVFIATLMGVQRHYFINNVRIITGIVQACIIYYLLFQFEGYGLIVLALLNPVFTAIEFGVFAGAVYLDRNLPNISFYAVTAGKAKEMLWFGTRSAVMMIAGRLQNQSVPLIIGHVIGLAHVVYFVMPNRLVEYAKGVSLAIGFPLTPYFGAAIGRGDHGDLVKSWVDTSLALQVVTLAMPVVIFFCGEAFLNLWLGQEYALAGRIVLYILLAGLVADALASNAFRMLTAQARHGKCALVWLVLSALSIPMGILGAYWWGIEGVAAGTTFVTVLGNLTTLCMACTIMQVSVFFYFKKTIAHVLFPLLLLISAFAGLRLLVPLNSYGALITHVTIAGTIYLLSVWVFTLDRDSRGRVLDLVKFKTYSR